MIESKAQEGLLSVADVAERLGVTDRQVRRLITAGTLPGVRVGRDLFVKPEDFASFKPRPKGRPSKSETKAVPKRKAARK
jgi:excisionase family DNA binding protein